MIVANKQWLLADALAAAAGARWLKDPDDATSWRFAGPLPEADAVALAADLRGAEIHALPSRNDSAWYVEADLDSRDAYSIPRAARDTIADRILQKLRGTAPVLHTA